MDSFRSGWCKKRSGGGVSERPHHIASFIFLICLFASCLFIVHSSYSAGKPTGKISAFYDLSFPNTLTKEENRYLGSSQKQMLSFRKIRGDIFVIEVFSTYCIACPKNIPVLNSVYAVIESDPGLRGKVKIVGIAVGDTAKEISFFQKSHGIHYPVLSDYNYKFHKIIGNPRVPYTIFMKRLPGGKKAVIFNIHQGVLDSPESILGIIKAEMH